MHNSGIDTRQFVMGNVLLITFLGYFPSVIKESHILIFPNCPWNTRIQCLLKICNTRTLCFDTRVNLWGDKVVVSLKPLLKLKCSTVIFWQKFMYFLIHIQIVLECIYILSLQPFWDFVRKIVRHIVELCFDIQLILRLFFQFVELQKNL